MSVWSGHSCPLLLKLLLPRFFELPLNQIRIRKVQIEAATTPAAQRRHTLDPDVSPG